MIDHLNPRKSTSTADQTTTGTAEFDRALEILERTCECGNDKMLLPDGKLGRQYVPRLGHATTAQASMMETA